MSLLIVGLDNTIVNVALPSIGRELHAPVSGLQWTIDAYTVVLASLLILAGSMADRLGRKRVFATGTVIFTLSSGLCSLAPSLDWLVAFRTLQAVGGSMMNPVAVSIIRNTFTDPRERAQAVGVWGGVFGLSLALGPVVGGVLVQAVGWPAVFWINLPIGLAAFVLTLRFVPESKAARPRRIDPVGQLLVIATLGSLTYAIIEGPSAGWTSARILALFAVAVGGFIALVWYEPRRAEPLLELRFFRSVPFSGATVIAVSAFAGLGGFLFLNTLYLQQVRGLSALHAGLYTLPMAAMTLVFGPLSGALVGRRGSRLPLVGGGAAIALSSVLLAGLSPATSFDRLLVAYFLFGIGFGLVNPPITNTAISGMPPSQAGVAASIASTSRQVGQSLGVAIVGALAASAIGGRVGPGLAHASHPGWWIIASCGAGVVVLGLVTTTPWAHMTARRTAALFEDEPAEAAVSA